MGLADLSQRLTGGKGVFVGAAVQVDLAEIGYVAEEFVAAGTATSYQASGELTADGRWTFTPADSAAYRTRVLVRRPTGEFGGTVFVEWLNVSGGVDADPDWAGLHEEITRRGDVWVGVSAQRIGVAGGAVLVEASEAAAGLAGKGLAALDPERYGSLVHPGDGFSFDIFTQVARAVRAGAGLSGLTPERVIAVGESQSAAALVTYYNGVQPLTQAFDGFFVHSRSAAGLPLAEPGASVDLSSALLAGTTAIFRTDLATPVLDIQAEGDLVGILNSAPARQPDDDRFRLWEVAGTAHADAHLLGPQASSIDCGVPINDGPLHVVAKAGLRALVTWISSGHAPARAPRVTVDGTSVTRDGDGIALGGIRTPPVDVPVDALSGDPGPNPSRICLLLGQTNPLPAARLAELYVSRGDYEKRYADATDEAIAAGFVLEEDRAALLAYAQPARVAG